MRDLETIASENGTGKVRDVHDYIEKYETFFAKHRDKDISLLEIGVSTGASHRTWYEYFPKAKIYGIDIDSSCKKSENDRTKIFIGNQSNKEFLNGVIGEAGPFDIIIDDGSHVVEDMMASFVHLFPHVKDGGLYVIEDLHCNYADGRPNKASTSIFDYISGMMEAVHFFGNNVDGQFFGNKTRHLKTIKDRVQVTDIEKTLQAIHLYSSIVFFEKKNCDE